MNIFYCRELRRDKLLNPVKWVELKEVEGARKDPVISLVTLVKTALPR